MSAPALPEFSYTTSATGTDWLVIGLTEAGLVGLPTDLAKAFEKTYGRDAATLARELGARPKAGRTTTLPAVSGTRLLVTGLGDADPTPEKLRTIAGDTVRALVGLADEGETVGVTFALDISEPEIARAVAEGALLGSYTYRPVSGSEPKTARIGSVRVLFDGPKSLAAEVTALVDAVLTAREWINIPPNLLYPETLAEAATDYLRGTKVKVEVLDDRQLADQGYGGLTAVGGGSSRGPRLVRMTWSPRGAKKRLALVGKGITFDSGGLNLKPGDSMLTMKSDMSGAAAVITTMKAIAEAGLRVQVTAYAALAENLPSASSYRPSDVLTIYGGTTVENMNTDAEGRLVMADALARANEDDPDLVIDIATLTGACIVALGTRVAGVMATSDEVAQQILDAAESSGESFWQLPIPEEIDEALASQVADVRSTTGSRWGGALAAAAFLHRFVDGERDWAHLDIAGPSFNEGSPYGYTAAGGTGFGVRTMVEVARQLAG